MPNAPSVVILVIDQLPASLLGPYGNTMIETASFNRLAAQSLVFDFAFSSSIDLKTVYRNFWAAPQTNEERILISDDPEVAGLARSGFDRVLLIEQPAAIEAATSPATTQLANFFAQATAWIADELCDGQMCWIHSQGLAGVWDAPYELREKFVGEEDPPPPKWVDSPNLQLDPELLDPDELLGFQQAAAAQIALLDDCLGVLLDQLDELASEIPVLLICTAARGCGLGEHGLVGIDQQLFSEVVQVPLMLRFPSDSPRSLERIGRSSSLVSTAELPAIWKAWLNANDEILVQALNQVDKINPDHSSEILTIINDQYEMIQTHAWKLIRRHDGNVLLFAKPDDRWEINNVSDRCPLIVEKLIDLLDRRVGLEPQNRRTVHLDHELAWRKD